MKIFLLAALLTLLTVVIHSLATFLTITQWTRWSSRQVPRYRIRVVGFIALLVICLLATHLVEAGVWALAYYVWQELPDFPTALYYSLTSYSTVGYGDVVLPVSSRLLGPIESVVGILMLGWSTAVIVAVFQDAYRERV